MSEGELGAWMPSTFYEPEIQIVARSWPMLILQNPNEQKFRSIKLDNAAFQARVASLPSSLSFLQGVGFEQQGNVLILGEINFNHEKLNAAGECLNNALTNPMFGLL